MAQRVSTFDDIRRGFLAYIADIRYCTMVTVDSANRPRARVMLPIWEIVDDHPVGWLAVYRTPVKAAHLARNPNSTYSYWSPRQDAVHIDAISSWVDDAEAKAYAWNVYCAGSPAGVGYDPIGFWPGGPTDPSYHLIRIDPWRIQLVRGTDLSSVIWRTAPPKPVAAQPAIPAYGHTSA
jgi:general stress protein 26